MIDAEDLIYEYARARALDGATVSAPAGEITALVGPNGAGKTTLMRILAGLMRPQSGRAMVAGIDVAKDPSAVHKLVAFTADFIGLYDDLTAERHLIHAGRCAGLSRAEARVRAEEAAGRLDIQDLSPRRAEEMSRGQRQRLAIAQALMKKPQLLILDEPASGLDPEARRGLSELLLQLKAEGATILASSHILSELDDYSDRVAVMRGGRVLRVETLNAKAGVAASGAETEIVTVTVAAAMTDLRGAMLAAAPGLDVVAAGGETAQIRVAATPEAKSAALSAFVAAGLPVIEFATRRRRLADAYFESAEAGDSAG